MEKTGTVIERAGDRVVVRLDGDLVVFAANLIGADRSDRVHLFFDPVTWRENLAYAAPLAGMLLGALAGKMAARIESLSASLAAWGGSFAGPILQNPDNLALAGGLFGLIASLLALWRWSAGRVPKARVDRILEKDKSKRPGPDGQVHADGDSATKTAG